MFPDRLISLNGDKLVTLMKQFNTIDYSIYLFLTTYVNESNKKIKE